MQSESEHDLLWGAGQIATVLFGRNDAQSRRRAFHLLENKMIPAKKIGDRWVAERGQLRASLTGEAS